MKNIILANRSLPLDYANGEMPSRIHIVPRGELVNKEAGVTQILDDTALNSILADLKNRHAKRGGLYMGEEHFIYDSSKSSQAFAWGKEFGMDGKGIWATKFDPTDVGEPAIKNKRFKFTSFVADPETPGAVENLGNGRVRILKIDTVGFTNFANGRELLTPITNRSALDDDSKAQAIEEDQSQKAIVAASAVPTLELETWLVAVSKVRSMLQFHSKTAISFQEAWDLCRKAHPDLYAAVFSGSAAMTSEGAAQDLNKLANRIYRNSGLSLIGVYDFMRENLPAIYNRVAQPMGPIQNRGQISNAQSDIKRAADVLTRLASAESAANNVSLSLGLRIIANRHPGLDRLAKGQMEYEAAVELDPTLADLL